jgi:hypothetical protein
VEVGKDGCGSAGRCEKGAGNGPPFPLLSQCSCVVDMEENREQSVAERWGGSGSALAALGFWPSMREESEDLDWWIPMVGVGMGVGEKRGKDGKEGKEGGVREKVRWPIYRDHSTPATEEDFRHFREFVQDEVYAAQTGPYCGATSIASTVQSYLRAFGHPADVAEQVTQESVVELYRRLGVAGLERSTARVGNMTLKRCLHLLRVPRLEHVRFVPRELSVTIAATESEKRDAFWERICAELERGVRLLAHIRNHYVRIFGFRHGASDLTPVGTPLPDADLPVQEEGGSSGDEEEEVGGVEGGRGEGQERKPKRRRPRPAAAVVVTRGAQPVGGTRRRELLTAVRGQKPKHWVNFDDVCDLFDRVPLYRLFAVDARGLE